jgi:hypothetical protein
LRGAGDNSATLVSLCVLIDDRRLFLRFNGQKYELMKNLMQIAAMADTSLRSMDGHREPARERRGRDDGIAPHRRFHDGIAQRTTDIQRQGRPSSPAASDGATTQPRPARRAPSKTSSAQSQSATEASDVSKSAQVAPGSPSIQYKRTFAAPSARPAHGSSDALQEHSNPLKRAPLKRPGGVAASNKAPPSSPLQSSFAAPEGQPQALLDKLAEYVKACGGQLQPGWTVEVPFQILKAVSIPV